MNNIQQNADDLSDVPSEEMIDTIKLFLNVLASRGIDHGLMSVDYHNREAMEKDQLYKADAYMMAAIIKIDGIPTTVPTGQAMAREKYGEELRQAYDEFKELARNCQYIINPLETENIENAEKRLDALKRVRSNDPAISEEAVTELKQLAEEKDRHMPAIFNAITIGNQDNDAAIEEQLDIAKQQAADQALEQQKQQHRDASVPGDTIAQWEVEKRIVAAVIDLQKNPRWKIQKSAAYEYFRGLEDRYTRKYGPVYPPISPSQLEEYRLLKQEMDKGEESFGRWISVRVGRWRDFLHTGG